MATWLTQYAYGPGKFCSEPNMSALLLRLRRGERAGKRRGQDDVLRRGVALVPFQR